MAKNLKHKKAVIIWISIYPLITATNYFFGEQLLQLPLPFRTLVLTVVLVILMNYLVIPFYSRLFAKWLNK